MSTPTLGNRLFAALQTRIEPAQASKLGRALDAKILLANANNGEGIDNADLLIWLIDTDPDNASQIREAFEQATQMRAICTVTGRIPAREALRGWRGKRRVRDTANDETEEKINARVSTRTFARLLTADADK